MVELTDLLCIIDKKQKLIKHCFNKRERSFLLKFHYVTRQLRKEVYCEIRVSSPLFITKEKCEKYFLLMSSRLIMLLNIKDQCKYYKHLEKLLYILKYYMAGDKFAFPRVFVHSGLLTRL